MARLELSVLLILVSAIKCLAMNHHELEDFADYLKKTSQLSPTLKMGVEPDYDYDEDESVSEHAWEESGKFEGDLVLNERQRRLIVENVAEGLSRNGIRDGTKRWPNNEVIYFIQREHFNSDQVQAIQSGIDDLARASCVTFRAYRKGDRDAVVIQGSRRGCFSQVGYQGGYQVLNLSGRHPAGRGCFRHGTVVHELLHTLGFYHMQSSPDRDDYVKVAWENVIEPARHNFRKYNLFAVSDFGVGYDYDSVLHYSRRAFSVNGRDTIVPKKIGAEIGQRIGLSDKDAQKLNKMYCDADSNDLAIQLADEQATEKTEVKIKNKPFNGHGIGYHQGKAVAIKLLPAAETYKLLDVPSFHVFDYFSKAPQTLPTPENQGFRIGKEIAYSYNPPDPSTTEEHSRPIVYTNTATKQRDKESRPQIIANRDSYDIVAEVKNHYRGNVANTNKQDTSSDTIKPLDLTENLNQDYHTFDRLSKIIKHHVCPSQTPNLDIYKSNEDDSGDSNHSGIEHEHNEPPFMNYRKEQIFHGFNRNISPKDDPENRDNFDVSKKERTVNEEHSYNDDNFVLSDPYYESFPIYKQLTKDHFSDERRHNKHRNSIEHTNRPSNGVKSNLKFDNRRPPNPDKWYGDYTPQYNPFSDQDSYSDSLFVKSNGSAREHMHDPHDRRKKNGRYSMFHGRTPDYSLSAPVQFVEDWYGTHTK